MLSLFAVRGNLCAFLTAIPWAIVVLGAGCGGDEDSAADAAAADAGGMGGGGGDGAAGDAGGMDGGAGSGGAAGHDAAMGPTVDGGTAGMTPGAGGLAGLPGSPGGSPNDCGGLNCPDPSIEGLAACCRIDMTCGVRSVVGIACVDMSEVEPKCAQDLGPGPGCCLPKDTCGFVGYDERCTAAQPVPGLPSFGTEQRCDGKYYCRMNACADPSGLASPCCLPNGSCGVITGPGVPPPLGGEPAYSPTGCLEPALLDENCRGGCCTNEGYCGRPSLDGTQCLLDATLQYSTDCMGELRPFTCGGVVCPERPPNPLRYPRPRCCTATGACGLFISGACIDSSILDPDCPDQTQAVGCCAEMNRCGVWDGANKSCLASPSLSGLPSLDCDGNIVLTCGATTCTGAGSAPFPPCCTPSSGCGALLPSSLTLCVDKMLIAADCPGDAISPVGCCTATGVCGTFNANGDCAAGSDPMASCTPSP